MRSTGPIDREPHTDKDRISSNIGLHHEQIKETEIFVMIVCRDPSHCFRWRGGRENKLPFLLGVVG
jgi:hypothetical protein